MATMRFVTVFCGSFQPSGCNQLYPSFDNLRRRAFALGAYVFFYNVSCVFSLPSVFLRLVGISLLAKKPLTWQKIRLKFQLVRFS